MPRLTKRLPAYQLHKASGQAVVKIDGACIYLGRHKTAASRAEYDRVVGEWVAAGRARAATSASSIPLHMMKLAALYLRHAAVYYKSKGELAAVKSMIRVVRLRYGRSPAGDFGPKALRAVREDMIAAGWCRKYINNQVHRLRQMFKWAVGQELLAESVYGALLTVEPLKRGRCNAPESRPVTEVPDAAVDAIEPHVSRHVWAIVRLQRLTGMRPGEACMMRTRDVDRAKAVWKYTPASHKTEHHGHGRTVLIGPRAQEILTPWLRLEDPGAYLFRPAEAEAERLAALHEKRKREGTPLHHGNAPGTNRRRRPRVKPGDCYTVNSYRRAITRACELAFGMPDEIRLQPKSETPEEKKRRLAAAAAWRAKYCWHPHQLRHTAGTRVRERFGLEEAQAVLGHETLSATQVYAARKMKAAEAVMGEVG